MTRYPINHLNEIPVWPYCDARIKSMMNDGMNINTNIYNVYKSYIRWYDDYMTSHPIVNSVGVRGIERRLESYVPDNVENTGTVYITQYNVEMYVALVMVNYNISNTAFLKKKITIINMILKNVENIVAAPISLSPNIRRMLHEHHIIHMIFLARLRDEEIEPAIQDVLP